MNAAEKEDRQLNGLYLFKALVKSGAVWEGDIVSKTWSEYLAVPPDRRAEVEAALTTWEVELYKCEFWHRKGDPKVLVGVWVA